MKPTKIVYLHGFNSSPESRKAQLMLRFMREIGLQQCITVPEIPPAPDKAIDVLRTIVDKQLNDHEVAFVGSSLGGFYATWLAEKYGCKAVLVNPAVRAHELLEQYLGENTNYYSTDKWVLNEDHIQLLYLLNVEVITRPERYLLMLQKGDETLDYKMAIEQYSHCPQIIEEGGDHSFTGFDQHIQNILEFCGIRR